MHTPPLRFTSAARIAALQHELLPLLLALEATVGAESECADDTPGGSALEPFPPAEHATAEPISFQQLLRTSGSTTAHVIGPVAAHNIDTTAALELGYKLKEKFAAIEQHYAVWLDAVWKEKIASLSPPISPVSNTARALRPSRRSQRYQRAQPTVHRIMSTPTVRQPEKNAYVANYLRSQGRSETFIHQWFATHDREAVRSMYRRLKKKEGASTSSSDTEDGFTGGTFVAPRVSGPAPANSSDEVSSNWSDEATGSSSDGGNGDCDQSESHDEDSFDSLNELFNGGFAVDVPGGWSCPIN